MSQVMDLEPRAPGQATPGGRFQDIRALLVGAASPRSARGRPIPSPNMYAAKKKKKTHTKNPPPSQVSLYKKKKKSDLNSIWRSTGTGASLVSTRRGRESDLL